MVVIWTLAMVPVVFLSSLRGIGWLTGGAAMIVTLACPQAMATIGVMAVSSCVVAILTILMGSK